MMAAQRQQNTTPASGTATMTATSTPAQPADQIPLPFRSSGTLRLRAEAEPSTTRERRIQWAEDVVDNENMGKKSSKGGFSLN